MIFEHEALNDLENIYTESVYGEEIYTEGLVKKVNESWRVVSGKTGKLWPQKYDSKEKAQKALKAYWVNKNYNEMAVSPEDVGSKDIIFEAVEKIEDYLDIQLKRSIGGKIKKGQTTHLMIHLNDIFDYNDIVFKVFYENQQQVYEILKDKYESSGWSNVEFKLDFDNLGEEDDAFIDVSMTY